MAAYLFIDDDLSVSLTDDVISYFSGYAESIKKPVYLVRSPLGDEKYNYDYEEGFLFAAPGHKLVFICKSPKINDDFESYVDDFQDDIGHISDKYEYKSVIGRRKSWGDVFDVALLSDVTGNANWFREVFVDDLFLNRKVELFISLVTGSINDIRRVGAEEPETILDKVKRKIILFDADQTKFVFQRTDKKRIVVQGLAGSGKTELLLHKLKELYMKRGDSRIAFTCHNKILAENMRNRIPRFFDFMKVERQIEWGKKLWCMHAWGSRGDSASGLYSYICNYYGLAFYNFKQASFDFACRKAISQISEIKNSENRELAPAFDYIFIDESQDFPESFLSLCELVANERIYVAGDIFQNIFQSSLLSSQPDFALKKCYRTDPKTLMFAQAFGMGLFEVPKLRWLHDDEWDACGYTYWREGEEYVFQRDPLKRFEDLEANDLQSVVLKPVDGVDFLSSISSCVLDLMSSLRQLNPTLGPSDIAIIFLDRDDHIYAAMDEISFKVLERFGWKCNISHNTKSKVDGEVFVSNINNAKGLEFPFVICVTRQIGRSMGYRNAAYTMLSRSFIQSYLVFPRAGNEAMANILEAGLRPIMEQGVMRVGAPSSSEIEGLTRAIEQVELMTLEDIVNDFCRERALTATKKARLHKWVRTVIEDEYDLSSVKEFLEIKYKNI